MIKFYNMFLHGRVFLTDEHTQNSAFQVDLEGNQRLDSILLNDFEI